MFSVAACSSQPQAPAGQRPPETPSASRPVTVPETRTHVAGVIRDTVENSQTVLVGPLAPAERGDLQTFYRAGEFRPVWTDDSGHPTRDANDALALLSGAATEGLDPVDYGVSALRDLSATIAASAAPSDRDLAAFDAGLSAGTLRYFRHLHVGRVDPRTIGFRTIRPDNEHDYVIALRAGLDAHRIPAAAAALAPPLELYRGLRDALARYRTLAAGGSSTFHLTFSGKIEPGQPLDEAVALGRFLALLGDVPAGLPAPVGAPMYDAALVEGVKRFQRRHGLAADGVLGKATVAALNAPLAQRVRQIELGLERLRWLPHLGPGRFIGVNIPMFRLWAWDAISASRTPPLGMGVIVGRAPNTRTPVLASEMSHLVFRPYWNVPASIASGELIPAWRKDRGYFDRHALELVSGPGDDATFVPATDESVADLAAGLLRLRQRPGPNNSLGLVKFIFPNEENVYLHSTPATELFNLSRRDFSHGCVRVEDPLALAEWALGGQGDWTRERIAAAMQGSRPLTINLDRPIQVILFYITALVLPEDGATHFAADIYGHDAMLDKALARRAVMPQ